MFFLWTPNICSTAFKDNKQKLHPLWRRYSLLWFLQNKLKHLKYNVGCPHPHVVLFAKHVDLKNMFVLFPQWLQSHNDCLWRNRQTSKLSDAKLPVSKSNCYGSKIPGTQQKLPFLKGKIDPTCGLGWHLFDSQIRLNKVISINPAVVDLS